MQPVKRDTQRVSKGPQILVGQILELPEKRLAETVGETKARWLRAYLRGRDMRWAEMHESFLSQTRASEALLPYQSCACLAQR